MNQKIKISQLPAKGSNLAAADLLEIAEFTGTGYISKSITGQEIIDAIPAPSVDWGDIGGTLSDQTDLNTALSGKVPTSRTLTINGTTQDLSADRTFTISTGITIGTTAITSGTVGRVLFEGTGNVVQESANLTFDSATTKLQLGILTPTATTTPAVLSLGATYGTNAVGSTSNIKLKIYDDNTAGGVYGFGLTSNLLEIHSPNTTGIFSGGGATRTQVFSVNTAGSLFGSTTLIATTQPFLVALGGTYGSNTAGSVANLKLKILGSNAFSSLTDYGLGISAGLFEFSASDAFGFFTGNSLTRTERMRIFAGGNIGINTTTDAGFRLDVNGTARATKVVVGASTASPYQLNVWGGAVESYISLNNTNSGNLNTDGFQIGLEPNGTDVYFINRENGFIQFRTNNLDRFRIFSTGNIGINTTTDAGFKLDVNGSTRIKGAGTTVATKSLDVQNSAGTSSMTFYDDLSVYINGKNASGYNTNILLGGQSNTANISFFGNNNIYVGQGNSTENIPSALIAMGSTTKGFLCPRMTTTQKNAIASPATGLQVFDTTLNRPCFYDGTTWITL